MQQSYSACQPRLKCVHRVLAKYLNTQCKVQSRNWNVTSGWLFHLTRCVAVFEQRHVKSKTSKEFVRFADYFEKILFFSSSPLCLGQWDDVQHRETRVPEVRQGAPGEHLRGPHDLQSPPGGNPIALWQRGQPGLRAPPQWTGLLWGGMSPCGGGGTPRNYPPLVSAL